MGVVPVELEALQPTAEVGVTGVERQRCVAINARRRRHILLAHRLKWPDAAKIGGPEIRGLDRVARAVVDSKDRESRASRGRAVHAVGVEQRPGHEGVVHERAIRRRVPPQDQRVCPADPAGLLLVTARVDHRRRAALIAAGARAARAATIAGGGVRLVRRVPAVEDSLTTTVIRGDHAVRRKGLAVLGNAGLDENRGRRFVFPLPLGRLGRRGVERAE